MRENPEVPGSNPGQGNIFLSNPPPLVDHSVGIVSRCGKKAYSLQDAVLIIIINNK